MSRLRLAKTVEQPNHIETVIAEVDVDGEQHLVSNADGGSRALQQTMLTLLAEQLAAKRLTPRADVARPQRATRKPRSLLSCRA
jgi:hypothetical protein